MASKGYSYSYNGAWVFASEDNPHAWHITPWNFLPRFGAELPPAAATRSSASPTRAT